MFPTSKFLLCGIVICFFNISVSVYLPGVAPTDYSAGEEVELKVNKISSMRTQLPLDYYSLPYCRPTNGIQAYSENLGEFLQGDRLENSPYDIKFFQEETCRILCKSKLEKKHVETLNNAIIEEYHNNWIVDGLPAGSLLEESQVPTGFPVGYKVGKDGKDGIFLYNHVNILIDYHSISADSHRIVGFNIEPVSVQHVFGKESPSVPTTCAESTRLVQSSVKTAQPVAAGEIIFTYGVQWRPSDLKWASRWDVYLEAEPGVDRVQWFAISNSMTIVLLLAAMVGYITYRSIVNDINEYNRPLTDLEKEQAREESGWKLVHADVFRPPGKGDEMSPLMFCVIVGSGTQLFVCALIGMVCTAFGFLSPTARGSIMLGMLLVFVLTGAVAGFTSARLYKGFKGRQWQKCTLLTATLFPGLCFSIFLVLNGIVSMYGSTGAVPMLSLIMVLFLWFGVSVPLVFFGAYMAFKKDAIEFPTNIGKEPRVIPHNSWYSRRALVCFLSGILPFSAMFVELFFVMNSLWTDKYYFLFGFLLIVFCILTVTCAEVSIVVTYFQLCAEDYRWWWTSICSSGTTAIYVFLYSVVYFFTLQSNMAITYFLYFGYMTLICVGLFLVTGAIGFFSSLYFNIAIYSSVKVD